MNQETASVKQDGIRAHVREQYGQIALSPEAGCCAPAPTGGGCCGGPIGGTAPSILGYDATAIAELPAGAEMGLGCGNPLALASLQPGEVVVDLGSGGGIDCFLAARRVGPSGQVIGVDMTPAMISKARGNAAKGGYANVEFRLGEIEHLPVADNTATLIISNCVINLSPDKAQVIRECHRILRPGGRLSFSDIVASSPLPEALLQDLAVYAGCVAGAALISDLEQMLRAAGFHSIRITPNESSRAFIDDWFPGKEAGRYTVSSLIEAVK
jgi:SAM-dependent methyltransferase